MTPNKKLPKKHPTKHTCDGHLVELAARWGPHQVHPPGAYVCNHRPVWHGRCCAVGQSAGLVEQSYEYNMYTT